MENSTLPNLLVIGAMKSGTTSLHHYLSIHPRIFMSEIKELNYFIKEENASKGIDWYKSNFDSRFMYNGESSQNYSKRHLYKGVPKRIKKTLGNDVNFIYIVRDPIKRIISHVNEAKFLGNRKNSFNLEEYSETQLRELNYVLTSMYYYQIEPYLELFPNENFHFVCFEELSMNPQKELNKIFSFLNLENVDLREQGKLIAKNVSKDKKVEAIWLREFKRGAYMPSIIKKSISPSLKSNLLSLIGSLGLGRSEIRQISLSTDLRNKIEIILTKDIDKFKSLAKRNFKDWTL